MKLSGHPTYDWCHVCGKRSVGLVDVWYPDNAEHGGPDTRYVRVCNLCAQSMYHECAKARNYGISSGIAREPVEWGET